MGGEAFPLPMSANHHRHPTIPKRFCSTCYIDVIVVMVWRGGSSHATGRNDIALILSQLQMGLFPGISMLAQIGLCSAPPPFGDGTDPEPYPIMKRLLAA